MTDCKCDEEAAQAKILPDWKKVFVSREEFLKLLGLSLSAVIGLIATIPAAAFILNYLFIPKRLQWVSVGTIEGFIEGATVRVGFKDPYILPWDGVSGERSAWLRRDDKETFTAFAINCTHLGCPVRWEDKADLFMCPCHGGVYYSNGDVAGGPPPRALHRYPVRINDGKVQIQVGEVLTEG